jgi:uncharacterized repeat protein (TIGR03803 family)
LNKLTLSRAVCIVVFCAAAISSPAQTFTSLLDFNGSDGAAAAASLVQAANGKLYGSTGAGGIDNVGTIFEVTARGVLRSIHSFSLTDGESPAASLVQANDGSFYGTTILGGANGWGSVFKITPDGALTTLYSFCSESNCADGSYLYAGLVQGTDGNFYGATGAGGTNGEGTIFKITPHGVLTTLHNFDYADGSGPYAALIQGNDGSYYGTTSSGGLYGDGTVFKITASGVLTTMHSFDSTDGLNLDSPLLQASNGNFYGATQEAGVGNGGTIFKITPSGTLTTVYSFCSLTDCTDGSGPHGGLVEAAEGNLYGTTLYGGLNGRCASSDTAGCGTIFEINPDGALTTLHIFDSTDGANPSAGLVHDTDGNFYGTTQDGGSFNDGTVFSLSTGLRPFVKLQPSFGKAGTTVIILGTNLATTTGVSFNGTAATFMAISSAIETTVPAGATTGTVEVITPSGTLLSNVVFQVK